MTWAVFLALLGVAVVVAGAWLLGRPRPQADGADAGGPVDGTLFGSQLRGYRMDQVDAVVDRLEARIAEHDREIARRRGEPVPDPAPATSAPVAERSERPGEDEPPPHPVPQPAGRRPRLPDAPCPCAAPTCGHHWPTCSSRPGSWPA